MTKTTYHLSHIDLDGYGCQYITANTVKGDLRFLNCNYGEIIETLQSISGKIKQSDRLLITDLNLTKSEAEMIQEWKNNIGFELVLLDHHGTGKDVAEFYDWYHLDTSHCATYLTWEYFGKKESLQFFAEVVNSYDLWYQDHQYFSKGKALTRIVEDYNYSFPKGLEEKQTQFIIAALDNAIISFISGASVAHMESNRYGVERTLFLNGKEDNPDLTMHEIKVEAFTDLIINQDTKPYTIVKLAGFDAYVFTGLSKIFQTFSNKILMENDEIDIAINISSRGTMSIRSRRTDLDLGQISREYFDGGGHPQAAGGKIEVQGDESDKELVELFQKTVRLHDEKGD